MIKCIKKALNWYNQRAAESVFNTPTCMVPVKYLNNK